MASSGPNGSPSTAKAIEGKNGMLERKDATNRMTGSGSKSADFRKIRTASNRRLVSSANSTKTDNACKSPNATPDTHRMSKPSDRLNPKVIDPFYKTSGMKSKFASLYSSGSVPCRLLHGSVRHKLQWDTPPENLNFDPLLVTLAEGLRETKHPYSFIAKEGFKQMMCVTDAGSRTLPLLGKLIPAMRLALGSDADDAFRGGIDAVVQLSDVVGPALNPHLKSILPLLGKKMLSKSHKETVMLALQKIEFNGGKDCVALIKARVPTYSSVYK